METRESGKTAGRLQWAVWALLALPVVTSGWTLIAFRQAAVEDGQGFVQALHFFGWILYYGLAWIVFVIASFLAILLRSLTRKPGLGAIILPLISFFVLLVIPGVRDRAFFAARDGAYGDLDLPAIHKACQEVHPTLWAGRNREIQEFDEGFNSLSEAIRNLRPMFVAILSDSVVLQMDGGGVMYHEGIAVVVNGRGPDTGRGIKKLRPDVPVYLYRLYDYRQFEDALK